MIASDSTQAAPPVGTRAQLAGAVAAAVDAVTGVRRSGGSGVEVATQYRGGRVLGVALGDSTVAVHVVAERLPLPALIAQVRTSARAALRAAGDPRPVSVSVDDLDVDVLPRLAR